MIDEPLKQQIKDGNDIVDVVGSYISLRPAGPTFKALCPFHEDHRPSFDVDPRRQRYRCWACGEHGDVIGFVQKYERVSFPEALELLARRAGISLENLQKNPQGPSRAGMLDVMGWATEQFQHSLLETPLAENARKYLGERKLTGETVRKFYLGYAPPMWEWLVQKAANAKISIEMLETVGLIAKRGEGRGYYDRFRDRVIFPIRDMQGRTVGFGGRILPSSPLSENAPKYYNSSETPLFSKSDQLYGIDLAKDAVKKEGFIAIVEGYTDVMMAHQHGMSNVISTMGTAFNQRHLKKLSGFNKIILVYDADAGGNTGADRALEIFIRQDHRVGRADQGGSFTLSFSIATLPEGLDPCDLIVAQGIEPFRKSLEKATEVFEFVLQSVWAKYAQSDSLDGKTQAVERLLTILARCPTERSVRMELMVNRIAQRLQIKEETVWTQLRRMRAAHKEVEARQEGRAVAATAATAATVAAAAPAAPEQPRSAPAAVHERELIEVLLAEPALVAQAQAEVKPEQIEHPGLRKVMEAMVGLHAEGQIADLDHLHGRLDNERLWDKVQQFQDRGLEYPDRPAMLVKVLERFRERREQRRKQAIKTQMHNADPATSLELLRQLKDHK